MALIKEYFELTKLHQDEYGENTIVLMQVGSFFEVYGLYNREIDAITGSKIVNFSQLCELNIVDKNSTIGQSKVMMAGFKDYSIEKYIKKIQDGGFTVVVYTQDESAKNTTRSLAGVFSPGTYFQTETPNLTNSIACVWIHLVENKIFVKGKFVIVGIANIDIYTGKTNIFQFKETYMNNPTTYDELERFISIHNPSEVILVSNLPEEKEIDQVISYAGITSALVHKIHIKGLQEDPLTEKMKKVFNCEKQPYQKEVLTKFYKFDDYDVFVQNFYEYNIATQSFCFLLDFVYQHNPHLVNNISEPCFENCSTRLVLANHTLKQLNIINDGNVKPSKYSCVSQMLNECQTPMGKRKFMYSILNPVFNEVLLQKEYDITEHFLLNFTEYNSFFKNNLSSIKDISKWERQIFLRKISPESVFGLYTNLLTIKEIYDKVSTDSVIMNYLSLSGIGTNCDKITAFIKANLDLKLAYDLDQTQSFDINFINPGIDAELDKKTEMLKECELKLEAIREYLSSLIENKEKKGKSSDYVKIHETEKNNFSLLCTSRRCKLLEEALPRDATLVKLSYDTTANKKFDFKISKTVFSFEKQSATNNCIIDEQIRGLCKTISSIKVSMKELITSVYNTFISKFEQLQMELENIIHFVTGVDVLHTKATIAKKYNYCKPQIIEASKSCVNATSLRHALIERFQTNEIYVANDIALGNTNNDAKKYVNGILLYGTNAVGKTTLIRALGIAIVMAQAGLYVPCSTFEFKPYKYIFSRIIGNDNIFKGLSTFAVEMSELRTILRLVDENSLVLGDELCSGTETMSAISIFVAGIQRLHKCQSSFIFATHLHEIVDFEEITELSGVRLKHMSVIYDKEQDMLIYDRKMKDGPGNNMYGLEVCKSLSLPEDFITSAYEIRTKYSPESKSLLSLKTSHYNAKKVMNMCEKCGKNPGQEVHHLSHQKEANEDGFIINCDGIFHKNNLANLMTLCEGCHNEMHKCDDTGKKGSRRVKTSKGYMVK